MLISWWQREGGLFIDTEETVHRKRKDGSGKMKVKKNERPNG